MVVWLSRKDGCLKSLSLFLIFAPFTSSDHLITLHTLSEPLVPRGKWGKDTVSELQDL